VNALRKVLRFADWPVRRKLVVLLVAASVVPLAAAAVLDIRAARERLRANAAELLAAHADHLRNEIDAFHRSYELSAIKLARLPALIALGVAGAEAAGAPVREILTVHIATDLNLRGIGVLDASGKVVVATEVQLVGKVLDREFLRRARKDGSAISDVHIAEPELGAAPVIAYAAEVPGSAEDGGLVVLWAHAEAFWRITRDSNELVGPGSYAAVFDEYGIRIANSIRTDIVFKPSGALAPDERRAMIAEQRFGADTQRLLDNVVDVPERYRRARAAEPARAVFRAYAPANGQWNSVVARRLHSVRWTVFYAIPEHTLDDQLATVTRGKVILAGVLMLAAFALGMVLASVILRPVVSLSAATQVIAAGDLSARVPQLGGDELGRLCASFNAMAERIERDDAALRQSRDELEDRVAERTVELVKASITEARAREALEASTARLEVLSRTGHELAVASGDARAVLPLAARRLGEIIGEACAIRLISEDGAWLEPARSFYHPDPDKGAIARKVTPSERQKVGDGIGGKVAATGEAVLIPVVTIDEIVALGAAPFRPLVEQLGVSSLLTLPLRSRDRVIGVVNLLRITPGRPYTIDDQRFAQDVADRAGLAIDNAVLVATLERRVAARTAALEAANHELEAFSYSVSHDLRAPLRAIDGFSHALLAEYGEQLTGEGERYIERIRASTQRMAALIDDLLKLARITRLQLRWAPVDLTALADQVAAELRRHDGERATPIHIAPGVSGKGDARLLTIVLENLLSNAWKFTTKHAAAEIWFGVEQRDGRAAYFVRDTGAGFDMKYADKLFAPFQRLHGPNEYDGVGVGLATVQRIITRHGGRIWAEAEIDRGATFFFTLGDPR